MDLNNGMHLQPQTQSLACVRSLYLFLSGERNESERPHKSYAVLIRDIPHIFFTWYSEYISLRICISVASWAVSTTGNPNKSPHSVLEEESVLTCSSTRRDELNLVFFCFFYQARITDCSLGQERNKFSFHLSMPRRLAAPFKKVLCLSRPDYV